MSDADRSWTAVTEQQFMRAVQALPADSRAVFQLRAFGRAYEQIAAELQIPRETVCTRLRQARAQLRHALVGAVSS